LPTPCSTTAQPAETLADRPTRAGQQTVQRSCSHRPSRRRIESSNLFPFGRLSSVPPRTADCWIAPTVRESARLQRGAAPSRCCLRRRRGSGAADGRSTKQSPTIAAPRCCSRPDSRVRRLASTRLLSPSRRRGAGWRRLRVTDQVLATSRCLGAISVTPALPQPRNFGCCRRRCSVRSVPIVLERVDSGERLCCRQAVLRGTGCIGAIPTAIEAETFRTG
jgi:hypothetical protein